MKNKLVFLFAMFAVFAVFVNVTSAFAQATVIKDGGCLLSAADSGLPSSLFTTQSHETITPNGNIVLSCKFDIPVGEEPHKALRNSDFPCGTHLGLTDHSRVVSTPGGEATLTCQINGADK